MILEKTKRNRRTEIVGRSFGVTGVLDVLDLVLGPLGQVLDGRHVVVVEQESNLFCSHIARLSEKEERHDEVERDCEKGE